MKLHFNWEITAGHILQLLVMLAALVGLYADARVYKAQMEMRVIALEKSQSEHTKQLESNAETSMKITVAVEKLTLLVEERTGRNSRAREDKTSFTN